jgi:two-component system response regulator DesR
LTWEGFQVDLAADGAVALRRAHELCADVVVLSLTRPLVRCFDTARELARAVPPLGVILLAFEEYLVEPAFQAGIRGYVLSTRLAEELATAIRTVGSGGRYLSPDIPAAYLVPGTDPAAE